MKKTATLLIIFSLFSLHGFICAEEDEDKSISAGSPLNLSGYVQTMYSSPEDGIDSFRIRRARLKLKGEILKKLHYNLQIDAVKSPCLLDATMEFPFSPLTNLVFGQFKVPFSLENLTSSSALDTINLSQTVKKLCPGRDIRSSGRDIGLAVNGRFKKIEYTFGIFNGSGINQQDNNENKDISARMVFSPFKSLSLGISHYNGKYSSEEGAEPVVKKRTGLETSAVKGKFSIKSEVILARDAEVNKMGWYVQGGFFPSKHIQTVIRYDFFEGDGDIEGDRISILTLGVNCFFSKKTKLQLNYEWHGEEENKISNNTILALFQISLK